MQNRYSSMLLLVLPNIILFGLISFFLYVEDAPPRPSFISSQVTPGQSFRVTFDKHLQSTPARKDDIVVYRGNEKIAGEIKKTIDSLVFTPQKPWVAGESYRVVVAAAAAARGNVFTRTIDHNFSVSKESVLYLGSEDQIMLGDPETGVSKPVTPDTLEVLSFSVGTDGRFVAIYSIKGDDYKNGVLLGEKNKESYEITVLPALETSRYSEALLCNDSQALLILAQEKMNDQDLEYFTLDWDQFPTVAVRQSWNLKDGGVYGGEELACSSETSRLMYRKSSGAFVINFLAEENEESLGIFGRAIGFSPRDVTVALHKYITEVGEETRSRSELSLYRSNGAEFVISEPDVVLLNASFSGDGGQVSILYANTTTQDSYVDLYTHTGATWSKVDTVVAPTGSRFTHQALSADGNTLMLEMNYGQEGALDVSTNTSQIRFWSLLQGLMLPTQWTGKSPQWAE